ncbi:MAG: fatty acid desaturase [Elusimicrobiota bacterium]|nr:MAG: fatty acid desaturase [Elusimicrobiota bacterium]
MNGLEPRSVRHLELRDGETAWPTAGVCLAALAVQAGSTAAAVTGAWPAAAGVLVNAACAYAQFTVLHDALHGSASRIRPLNEALGYAATFTLCGPYAAIRRNHLHHHAHANDPREDPDFWAAGETWAGTALRCLTMLQRHYWAYFTKLRRRDRAYAESVATAALILGLHAWAWAGGFLAEMLLYWTLPAQLAVAALALTFDYWPHRPHTARGRLRDTANILPAWLDPFFLCQNLHAVHHLFPQLPWYRYREAHAILDPGLRAAGVPQWGFRQAVRMLKPGPLPI